MAASRTLNVTITGDAKQFQRAMNTVSKQTDVVEGRIKRFSGTAKVAFGVAGAAAAGALVKGLKDSVAAAERAEVSQSKLQAQLKASGISYREHAKEIDNVIQRVSKLSALDDEDLQDSFTNIVRSTGDVSKSLRLVGLAADIARAKHIDVAKAGQLVAKVAAGNTSALGRYGIVIQKGATATQALGILQTKFAGSAAAYGRTAAGANDRFRVAVENLQERIGKALLPTLTRVTNRVATFTQQMADGTGAGGRFARQMQQTAEAMKPFFRILGDVAGAIASVTRWLARAAANVSLFVDDVRQGTHATGSFGATLHDVAATIGRVATKIYNLARGAVGALVSAFNKVKSAVDGVVSSVRWLIDHIPHIPKPHIPNLNPFGSPRQGWEKLQAQLNAGAAMPQSGTYGKAQMVARKFGLRVSSGYRSPQHNAAVGGVPNSLHTHGSPGNPGAIDLVGPTANMYQAQQWAGQHLNLKEDLVHDVGSGLHLHLGFFRRGGKVGGSGSGDTVPAMLEPGEFVVNRRAAAALGPQLEALNSSVPRFQKGGRVRGRGFKASWQDTQNVLTIYDKMASAGVITPEQATALKLHVLNSTSFRGQSDELDRRAMIRDLTAPPAASTSDPLPVAVEENNDPKIQELIDAQKEAADAARAQTEAITALKDEMAKSNAHADAVTRVSLNAAWKALADVVSGQIAGYDGYMGKAATAGAGSTYRL